MDKEKLLATINDGRTASVLLNWMDPIFKDVEKDLLASVKSQFRNGTYTELLLACHIAQLCALDDLKNRIQSMAHSADYASKELEKQGEPPDDYESISPDFQ